jgi:hypothetical protein
MRDLKNKTKLLTRISWVSRIWGIAYIVFFLIMIIGYMFFPQSKNSTGNAMGTREIIAFVFVFGYFTGLILAWKWEGPGGLIAIACVIAFTITLQDTPAFLHLLMAIPGLLFLVCWFLSIETSIKPE